MTGVILDWVSSQESSLYKCGIKINLNDKWDPCVNLGERLFTPATVAGVK